MLNYIPILIIIYLQRVYTTYKWDSEWTEVAEEAAEAEAAVTVVVSAEEAEAATEVVVADVAVAEAAEPEEVLEPEPRLWLSPTRDSQESTS